MSMPRITKGLGSLTARAFNRMSAAVETVERGGPGSRRSFKSSQRQPYFFLAKLTSALVYSSGAPPEDDEDYHADLAAEKEWNWIYSWQEVLPAPTTSTYPASSPNLSPESEGLAGSASCNPSTNTGAFNLREYQNFSRMDDPNKDPYMGPGQELPRYNSFYPEEVDVTSGKNQIVIMYAIPIHDFEEGEPEWWYFFDQDNPIKCEGDPDPSRASTLDLALDLGSLASPELDHSSLDFGGL